MSYRGLDGKPVGRPIVGLGRAGLVILLNEHSVLKIPALHRSPDASSYQKLVEDLLADQSRKFIENERKVYTRLGHYDGIVKWITLSEKGIEMAYMKNGPLSRYLELGIPPRHLVAQWIPTLANTVHYAHTRCVILGDIASRNILLADDMSVKLCDFTDSALMTLDCDMSSAEQDSITTQTDIFQFGSLVYEILMGKAYKYDLFANEKVDRLREQSRDKDWKPRAQWPPAEDLPETESLTLGQIIRQCWTGGYQNMQEICNAVEQIDSML